LKFVNITTQYNDQNQFPNRQPNQGDKSIVKEVKIGVHTQIDTDNRSNTSQAVQLLTPNTATPNTTTPNTTTPNTATPDTTTPNTITPNTATPNTTTPNTITPNTATPNTTTPNTATPNTTTVTDSQTNTPVSPNPNEYHSENSTTFPLFNSISVTRPDSQTNSTPSQVNNKPQVQESNAKPEINSEKAHEKESWNEEKAHTNSTVPNSAYWNPKSISSETLLSQPQRHFLSTDARGNNSKAANRKSMIGLRTTSGNSLTSQHTSSFPPGSWKRRSVDYRSASDGDDRRPHTIDNSDRNTFIGLRSQGKHITNPDDYILIDNGNDEGK